MNTAFADTILNINVTGLLVGIDFGTLVATRQGPTCPPHYHRNGDYCVKSQEIGCGLFTRPVPILALTDIGVAVVT